MPKTHVSAAGRAVPSTISRRAVLGALAAASVAVSSTTAAGSGGQAHFEIAELIADYRMKEAEQLKILDEATELEERHLDRLPRREVKYHMRVVVNGMESQRPMIFRSEEAIEHFFEPHATWTDEVRAAKLANCQRLILELRRAEAANEQLRRDFGITAAFELFDNSCWACRRAKEAIFAYRPKSLAEMDVKNAFLAEWFESGCDLSDEDIRLVFGGAAAS